MHKNIYKAARNIAGYSQERAAELLFISADTLSNYERGLSEPSKEMVGQMILIYQTQHLAIQYLSDSPLKKYVPECTEKELPDALINFLAISNRILEKQNKMIEVVADGKIDTKEDAFWDEVVVDANALVKATMELKFADRR